ncbi:MAG TPA: 50S ribosomal protein L11 methyltransferase [Polyangia bacterium]|nr:50S ribosomal protein L11 methyltransferase [Polyangia bacterium]
MRSRHELFDYHRSLLDDRVRTEAFRRAIAGAVRPGHVVVDLGCGSGILSLFACEAGARRVYSIEAGPVIELARAAAAANGFGDRIVPVQGGSKALTIPEPADVLVGEILGHGGLDEQILSFFIDARRFLRPDSVVIPRQVEILVAPTSAPGRHARVVGFWDRVHGFDYSTVKSWASRQTYALETKPDELAAEAAVVASIDLSSVTSPFVSGDVQFRFADATVIDGFASWFRARLSADEVLSNGPPLQTPSWRQMFLPLEVPLPVGAGDILNANISTLDGQVWRWRGETAPKNRDQRRSFDQSTFTGFPVIRKEISEQLDSEIPAGSPRTAAATFVLESLAGTASVDALADLAQARFPDVFPTAWAAKHFVRQILRLL